jgi:muramoyltetrapeptide carboxypeptidase
MRGGYGSLRLIDKLDYNIIRTNPKPFCGYSDSSILSAMFLKHAGLTSFSAPMLQGDFGAELVSSFTMDNFFEALKCKKLEFKGEALVRGSANGITWGGNLASICSLCGQDFIPDEPFIFFTEDLNEPVYKLDKMMTQLMNIEKFRTNIKGMVLGDFLGAPGFEEVFEQFNIPCASGFKITHEKDKITVPYGVKTSLNNGIFVVG